MSFGSYEVIKRTNHRPSSQKCRFKTAKRNVGGEIPYTVLEYDSNHMKNHIKACVHYFFYFFIKR